MDGKLKKGIAAVLITNLINVAFNFGTSLILPKYLSVDSYAQIKTYQLYIAYAGLFHFGFVDGMYLKYGGMELGHKIGSNITSDKSTMRVFQLFVSVALFVIALIIGDKVIIAFTLSVFPTNLINYYKLLYQATGEFKLYGKIMNATTILTFVANVVLVFLLRKDEYIFYLISYIVLNYLVWFYLEFDFRRCHNCEKGKVYKRDILIGNVKSGILLTLGNLSSVLLTGMDRWFVKALMSTYAFAQYSFAVTVETFLNTAITPVTTTLYNFFCREKDGEKHRDISRYVFVLATVLPCCAFLIRFILEIYLKNYIDSINVIFLLFAAQIFYIVIKSIFINLYKAQKRQKEYFWKLSAIIVIGFILNALLYKLLGTIESFAIGTLLSAVIWFFICIVDFKYLCLSFVECLYLCLMALFLILFGVYFPGVIGLLLYLIINYLFVRIFLRETYSRIIFSLKSYYRRFKASLNK